MLRVIRIFINAVNGKAGKIKPAVETLQRQKRNAVFVNHFVNNRRFFIFESFIIGKRSFAVFIGRPRQHRQAVFAKQFNHGSPDLFAADNIRNKQIMAVVKVVLNDNPQIGNNNQAAVFRAAILLFALMADGFGFNQENSFPPLQIRLQIQRRKVLFGRVNLLERQIAPKNFGNVFFGKVITVETRAVIAAVGLRHQVIEFIRADTRHFDVQRIGTAADKRNRRIAAKGNQRAVKSNFSLQRINRRSEIRNVFFVEKVSFNRIQPFLHPDGQAMSALRDVNFKSKVFCSLGCRTDINQRQLFGSGFFPWL